MAYTLAASYVGESLLSGFKWFDGADPTHGYVTYQSRANAEAKGLYSVDETTGVVRLGVDHTNTYGLSEGRPSIRLESKEAYNHGLFIADFLHMPPSQCGVWPAFWAYGSNWPDGGEVDIIEGVDTAHQNTMSAHTANGCALGSELTGTFSGEQRHVACAVGGQNTGCGFSSSANDASSYGDGFNAINGGVYAMQWDSKHIKVWYFARGQIPQDIEAGEPDPKGWKLPDAVFGGSGCDVDSFFKEMNLVINIDFCGDWGNAVWGKTDQCNNYAPTCAEYVANNPQAFANTYWDVRYIDAYQLSNSSSAPNPPSTTTTTSASATATESHGVTSSFIASPSATEAPANPAMIGNYTYLGCFGSSTGFQTFRKAGESVDMTLDKCVDLCDIDTFAGVLDSKCYCASALDADTRATSADEGGVCDHRCPGNATEFCGGIMERPTGMAVNSTVAPQHGGNTMLYATHPNVTHPNATHPNATHPNATHPNATHLNALRPPTRRRLLRRGIPNTYLLTMYGAVADPVPDSSPPPMAPGSNTTFTHTTTETTYATVFPLQSVEPTNRGKTGAAQAASATKTTVGTDKAAVNGHETAFADSRQPAATKAMFQEDDCEDDKTNESSPTTSMTRPPPPPANNRHEIAFADSHQPAATKAMFQEDDCEDDKASESSPTTSMTHTPPPPANATILATRVHAASTGSLGSHHTAEPTATASESATLKRPGFSVGLPVVAAAPGVRSEGKLAAALGAAMLAMAMAL